MLAKGSCRLTNVTYPLDIETKEQEIKYKKTYRLEVGVLRQKSVSIGTLGGFVAFPDSYYFQWEDSTLSTIPKDSFLKGAFSESPTQKDKFGYWCVALQSATTFFDISISTTDLGSKFCEKYNASPPLLEPTSRTFLPAISSWVAV